MASSVTDLRDGLKARLQAAGLHAYARRPAQLNPPCGIVEQLRPEHDQTLGNAATLTRYDGALLVVVAGAGGPENAEALIEPYLASSGDASVFRALVADRTLGGAAHSVFFGQWEQFEDEELSGGEYYAQRLPIVVWAG